ncbi:hypothetical protein [Sphingomonas sp.]|uniref:hypothetical protein n=1 Tax=Sphingomonas sp. TaxID=28214 RepID=UPI003B3BD3ED
MTPALEAAEIERLKGLLEKATPGEWSARHNLDWGISGILSGNHRRPIIADIPRSTLAHCDATLIVAAVNALPALLATAERVKALEAENARLRADLKHSEDAVVGNCEGCLAPLFDGDDFVSDPDGVSGCWSAMTDLPSKRERPCFAYRVGKFPTRALTTIAEGSEG